MLPYRGKAGGPVMKFDNTWLRDLPGSFLRADPDRAPDPQLLVYNAGLAAWLGLPDISDSQAARWFSGAEVPPGAEPAALAYAGHQFGGFSPQLGDGRAHLLGEILAPDGRRWDLQLKGSGRTPFSRGGDGKAALGPMLREYLISEAMAALAIPTTLHDSLMARRRAETLDAFVSRLLPRLQDQALRAPLHLLAMFLEEGRYESLEQVLALLGCMFFPKVAEDGPVGGGGAAQKSQVLVFYLPAALPSEIPPPEFFHDLESLSSINK